MLFVLVAGYRFRLALGGRYVEVVELVSIDVAYVGRLGAYLLLGRCDRFHCTWHWEKKVGILIEPP